MGRRLASHGSEPAGYRQSSAPRSDNVLLWWRYVTTATVSALAHLTRAYQYERTLDGSILGDPRSGAAAETVMGSLASLGDPSRSRW